MPTADELLSAISQDDIFLIIDEHLRTINIPSTIKVIGVESDDEVLRLHFKMPSEYCGIDLSTFVIRINYLNANGEGDIYDVDDSTVQSDNTITFSWLVGRHALIYRGNVTFNVCLRDVDTNGSVLREFNTTITTLPVLEGLETGEQAIAEYHDIFEQWRAKLFGVSDSEQAKLLAISQEQQSIIETKGVTVISSIDDKTSTALSDIENKKQNTLDSIPDDYTEVYQMAEEALRTKADAIVLESDGNAISINNASDDPLRGLKVFGKTTQQSTTGIQLFNAYAKQNNSFGNAIIENNGAKITVTGNYYVSWPISLKAGMEYFVNFKASGDTEYRGVRFEYPDKAITNTITNPTTFTPTQDTVAMYLYAGLGTEGTIIYENVQISEGSTALTWESYTGGKPSPNPHHPQDLVSIENSIINVWGKNLYSFGDIELNGNSKMDIIFTGPIKLPATLSWTQNFPRSSGSAMFGYTVDGIQYYVASKEDIGHQVVLIENGENLDDITLLNWAKENGILTNIQVEIGGSYTEYEYYKPIQKLNINHTLSGVRVSEGGNYTDSDDQQWICDEIDYERGVYIQRVGQYMLTGTENVNREDRVVTNTYRWVIWPTNPIKSLDNVNGWCSHFAYDSEPISYNAKDNVIVVYTETGNIYGRYDSFTSESEMKDFLTEQYESGTPVTIKYPLATPIETELTYEEIKAFKALRTNHPNTTILNDKNANMEIKYTADTLIYLRDNQPKPTDEQVRNAIDVYLNENDVQSPSDDHIKSLINDALGVIENGTY